MSHNNIGVKMKKKILIITLIIIVFIFILICAQRISTNSRIKILDKDNNEIMLLNNFNKTNSVNLNDINKKHIQFILYIEDKNFYNHHGFSIDRILKSAWNNLFKGSHEGGSTITQQYIKNTYLTNQRSILRKLKELYLAIKIESQMTKNEILEEYLQALYFGNNVYGITNAAKYYFDKDLDNLNDLEFLSLIALWNAPTVYSNNLDSWNQKKNKLAYYLYQNTLINYNEYTQLLRDIPVNINKEYLNSNRLYFIDQVISEFNNYRYTSGFNELITIKTAYDINSESINSSLDTNYAILAIDKDGYISTCIGDKSYYKSAFNIAINGNRDIGSTIKPLLYYEAIRCNMDNITFNSSPYTFKYKNENITISNNSNLYFNNINMYEALAVSDNIYATKMHLKLGMNTLVNHLKKYNIEAKPYPSLALGSIGMSLKKLASIYYQFFQKGYYVNPTFIKEISLNTKIYKITPSKVRLLKAEICEEVKKLLYAPFDINIDHATCKNLNKDLKTKCYGKSGSTDYDSYMVGFNDSYLVITWCGDINNALLLDYQYKSLAKKLFVNTINTLSIS